MNAVADRVLVTGGAGFIGSHLVDTLLGSEAEVTVLDDLSTGRDENLAHHRAGKLRFVPGSVLDADLVDRLVAGADTVYHLAAAVGVKIIMSDPVRAILTNVRGTEHVLGSAYRHEVPVLLASTSEIYGKNAVVPFVESTDRVLGSTWVHRWSYSTSKAVDEHLAFAYSEKGLQVSIVRYFNSYGPRLDERGYGSVIARFAGQALTGKPLTVHGNGDQTRCFTYVSDTVRGTILAATLPSARGHVFNLGSVEEVSIRQLAELIIDITGSRSEIQHVPHASFYGAGFEDTPRRVPDAEQAAQVLGFHASVSLREGLERTLEWCRDHYTFARAEG